MEALMTLDCSNYSESLVDILKVFQEIGWNMHNLQGKIEYLPIGDDDEYNWQSAEISEDELYEIILEKITKKEQVGVNLFYSNGTEGVSLLAYGTGEIVLSIDINRKIAKWRNTDMVWYLENIIYKLFDRRVRILSYKLEEYED